MFSIWRLALTRGTTTLPSLFFLTWLRQSSISLAPQLLFLTRYPKEANNNTAQTGGRRFCPQAFLIQLLSVSLLDPESLDSFSQRRLCQVMDAATILGGDILGDGNGARSREDRGMSPLIVEA